MDQSDILVTFSTPMAVFMEKRMSVPYFSTNSALFVDQSGILVTFSTPMAVFVEKRMSVPYFSTNSALFMDQSGILVTFSTQRDVFVDGFYFSVSLSNSCTILCVRLRRVNCDMSASSTVKLP